MAGKSLEPPSVTMIFWLFGDYLQYIPLVLRTAVVTIVVMLLMTYVLMPIMTKQFAFWLYSDQLLKPENKGK